MAANGNVSVVDGLLQIAGALCHVQAPDVGGHGPCCSPGRWEVITGISVIRLAGGTCPGPGGPVSGGRFPNI